MWVDPRGDAATMGGARAGRASIWAAFAICLVIGFLAYASEARGLTHLADPSLVKGAVLWAVQAPLIALMWLGALFG